MSMPPDAAFIPSEGSNDGPRDDDGLEPTTDGITADSDSGLAATVDEDNVPHPGAADSFSTES